MVRFVQGAVVMALVVFAGNWLMGQDTKPPRLRGQLYAKWRELGLTDEQKQNVYKIQAEYRGKIGELKQKISQLQREERTKAEAVLTAAQKARLRELLSGGGTPKDKAPPKETKDKTPPKDKPLKDK